MSKGRKISKYTNSSITDVKIRFNGETFKFNLAEELSINEAKLNDELKEQPSYYGFMKMLQARLLTVKEDLERQADKTYASKYLKAAEAINPTTNRVYSDKAAIQKALANEDYNKILEKSIKAKEDYNIVDACVRSFEQRASLIQTLAANMRRENQ